MRETTVFAARIEKHALIDHVWRGNDCGVIAVGVCRLRDRKKAWAKRNRRQRQSGQQTPTHEHQSKGS
jgi:hypothetical protein